MGALRSASTAPSSRFATSLTVERPRVVLVVPEAAELACRLEKEFPRIVWDPQGLTFAEWGERGYPGVARVY